jgi:hypothetical protein
MEGEMKLPKTKLIQCKACKKMFEVELNIPPHDCEDKRVQKTMLKMRDNGSSKVSKVKA